MRISDWSSDVCSSDLSFSQCLATFILYIAYHDTGTFANECFSGGSAHSTCAPGDKNCFAIKPVCTHVTRSPCLAGSKPLPRILTVGRMRWPLSLRIKRHRSEEHPFELHSLMRILYAVFCLKKQLLITSYTLCYALNTSSHY